MRTLYLLLLLLVAHSLAPSTCSADEGQKSLEQRVRDYVAAYNDRQLDTMLGMVTEDVQWLSVAGDKVSVETKGKTPLREGLEAYFKAIPSSKSELEWLKTTASRVAALEKASWRSGPDTKSQSSLSVYEFRGQLISRIYYFPAER